MSCIPSLQELPPLIYLDVGLIYLHMYLLDLRVERKSCTGVHEGHSTTAVQRLSSVAVCHLVSTPLNISSGNAKKVNIKLNTVSKEHTHKAKDRVSID